MEKFGGGRKQVEKLNDRKLENENNGQLIKMCQSGDYTYCRIRPSILLLVGSLVKGKSRWRSLRMRIMTSL